MRDQSNRRFSRSNKRRNRGGNGHRRGPNGNRSLHGNRGRGEKPLCMRCGHPAVDGKLCAFHKILLNAFRRELPEQDPRRLRY